MTHAHANFSISDILTVGFSLYYCSHVNHCKADAFFESAEYILDEKVIFSFRNDNKLPVIEEDFNEIDGLGQN